MVRHPDHAAGVARQRDVAALVVAHQLRLDIGAGKIGAVSMCEQKQMTGTSLSTFGRNGRVDIAMLIICASDSPSACNSDSRIAARDPLLFRRRLDVEVGSDGCRPPRKEKAVEDGSLGRDMSRHPNLAELSDQLSLPMRRRNGIYRKSRTAPLWRRGVVLDASVLVLGVDLNLLTAGRQSEPMKPAARIAMVMPSDSSGGILQCRAYPRGRSSSR